MSLRSTWTFESGGIPHENGPSFKRSNCQTSTSKLVRRPRPARQTDRFYPSPLARRTDSCFFTSDRVDVEGIPKVRESPKPFLYQDPQGVVDGHLLTAINRHALEGPGMENPHTSTFHQVSEMVTFAD